MIKSQVTEKINQKKHQVMRIQSVSLSFGGLKALIDVSLEIYQKEILAIIGPNGAGKSCMLNIISGIYTPEEGTVIWKGKKREKVAPHNIAKMGIARTFQNIALFTGMTVLDNILTGRNLLMKRGLFYEAMFLGWARDQEINTEKRWRKLLIF